MRAVRMVLIHVFLAIQLALPAWYYLGREDRNDERFAWRMFSSVRMLQCDARMTADGERVVLGREFHEAWITIARRGRLEVIAAMGEALCARRERVEIDLRCRRLDGGVDHYRADDICVAPALERQP